MLQIICSAVTRCSTSLNTVAGPTVTRLMAEMGAEIIKVELAPNGDLSRTFPYIKDGRSAYFVQRTEAS
jgi:crotonobetainyl-CoA:carnitine CoA-transferase CaiB-like acyl-CoA transferase